jgi:hypothetical protein
MISTPVTAPAFFMATVKSVVSDSEVTITGPLGTGTIAATNAATWPLTAGVEVLVAASLTAPGAYTVIGATDIHSSGAFPFVPGDTAYQSFVVDADNVLGLGTGAVVLNHGNTLYAYIGGTLSTLSTEWVGGGQLVIWGATLWSGGYYSADGGVNGAGVNYVSNFSTWTVVLPPGDLGYYGTSTLVVDPNDTSQAWISTHGSGVLTRITGTLGSFTYTNTPAAGSDTLENFAAGGGYVWAESTSGIYSRPNNTSASWSGPAAGAVLGAVDAAGNLWGISGSDLVMCAPTSLAITSYSDALPAGFELATYPLTEGGIGANSPQPNWVVYGGSSEMPLLILGYMPGTTSGYWIAAICSFSISGSTATPTIEWSSPTAEELELSSGGYEYNFLTAQPPWLALDPSGKMNWIAQGGGGLTLYQQAIT